MMGIYMLAAALLIAGAYIVYLHSKVSYLEQEVEVAWMLFQKLAEGEMTSEKMGDGVYQIKEKDDD